MPIPSPFVPVLAGVLVPELRPAQENARLEIGSQRGRNSHQIGVLGIHDLQGLIYGRTELLVADMRLALPGGRGGFPRPLRDWGRRREKNYLHLSTGLRLARDCDSRCTSTGYGGWYRLV